MRIQVSKVVGTFDVQVWSEAERSYFAEIDGEPTCYSELALDELLGVVARVALTAAVPFPPAERLDDLPNEWELDLVRLEGHPRPYVSWAIRQGELDTGPLTFDEMLGFLAAYALTDGKRCLFALRHRRYVERLYGGYRGTDSQSTA